MKITKFRLGHVVLYAKGWYNKTEDIWDDLLEILKLDDYHPITKNDVWSIILNRFLQDCELNILDILNTVSEDNCWKVGYYTNKHTWMQNRCELNEYDMPTATIYYILSQLRYLTTDEYLQVVPKYSKNNLLPKNVTLKQVIDTFNK